MRHYKYIIMVSIIKEAIFNGLLSITFTRSEAIK